MRRRTTRRRARDALTFCVLSGHRLTWHLQAPGYLVTHPKAERSQQLRSSAVADADAAAASARKAAELLRDPVPHLPPPEGWEAAAREAERAAEAEADATVFFDAPATLPVDELITSGAPVPPVRLSYDVPHCAV
jgi:hypothetical protein